MNALYSDILRDVRTLVEQHASARRTIQLSPEVAARLDALGVSARADDDVSMVAVANSAIGRSVDDDRPLAALEAEVAACTKCDLCRTRTQTVFSDGNPNAGIVFVGEAPGRDEDLQGTPFVGRAGQLLTDIIEKGMNLPRSEVYICNILKCRPPGNRDPHPDEVAQCEPYLMRQLDLVQPKVICCLGRIAAQTLLKTTESLGRLRGKWHTYHGIPLRATYHPAYILRQHGDQLRDAKHKTWMDVLEVLKVYRGEITP